MKHFFHVSLILISVLAMVMCSPGQQESLDKGLNAWSQGNYSEASRLFEPLAKKGNAEAQYHLGVMHDGTGNQLWEKGYEQTVLQKIIFFGLTLMRIHKIGNLLKSKK